jgi:hypothetical protein
MKPTLNMYGLIQKDFEVLLPIMQIWCLYFVKSIHHTFLKVLNYFLITLYLMLTKKKTG